MIWDTGTPFHQNKVLNLLVQEVLQSVFGYLKGQLEKKNIQGHYK
jgi:hypothetical protein